MVLLARRAERLSALASDIQAQGGKAAALAVDLSDAGAVAAVAQQVTMSFGVPDVLVNNAGAGRWLPILETSADEASRMMAVPYLAAFNITRELLPGMLARRSGRIVNISSVASRLAWPGAVAYTAARWAMEGFTAALRADLFGSGVDVTLGIFGTVESSYWQNNPGSRERLPLAARKMRALTPAEVGELIAKALESGQRTVIAPAVFRWLFLMNQLFPARTEATMCRRI